MTLTPEWTYGNGGASEASHSRNGPTSPSTSDLRQATWISFSSIRSTSWTLMTSDPAYRSSQTSTRCTRTEMPSAIRWASTWSASLQRCIRAGRNVTVAKWRQSALYQDRTTSYVGRFAECCSSISAPSLMAMALGVSHSLRPVRGCGPVPLSGVRIPSRWARHRSCQHWQQRVGKGEARPSRQETRDTMAAGLLPKALLLGSSGRE